MAFKKIDQDFVLSDSTKNVYGFRLLTTGFLKDEFMKNPIGYINHDKTNGVLLKWEDVRLSGDQVLGKPVINMEHPRAERTIKEIEDGFLNAASVGNICLLDYEFEENPDDADKPTLVGTKWYNKECSLVDSPGNRNAFKAGLFDVHENEINLSDAIQNFIVNKNSSKMKEIKLPITAALISVLSLSDEPTADAVVKGINDLHDRATKSEKDLKEYKDGVVKQEVKDLLDNALAGKKISAKLHDTLGKQYAGKPTELKEVLTDMGAFVSVTSQLTQSERAGAYPQNVKDLMDKGWDKLMESGEMKKLKNLSDEAYVELYEAKYGYKPNEKPSIKK
jgi:hypothetical protein